MRRRTTSLLLLSGLAALAAAALPATASAVPATQAGHACTRYADPSGDDRARGTAGAPYRTAQKLVDSLAAGQVGCLRRGVYAEDLTVARAGVTLTSAAGEQATVVGRLWIKAGADGVTIAGLVLNGRNAKGLPSPTVNADDVRFIGNEITNDNTEICMLIGSSWGRARGTVVRGNRIHHCGKLPAQNGDHGIYVGEADDTRILDNVIYSNADRGIQLYPDAQRTVVRGNVIDGNGVGIIFSGAGGVASNDTVVERNVITNSTIRSNVESYYPRGNPLGVNNVVRENCIGRSAARAAIAGEGIGFTATANISVGDPGYADRARGDFRIRRDSPCARLLRDSAAPADPAWNAPLMDGGEPTSGNPLPEGEGPQEGPSGETPSPSQPSAPVAPPADGGPGGAAPGGADGQPPHQGGNSGGPAHPAPGARSPAGVPPVSVPARPSAGGRRGGQPSKGRSAPRGRRRAAAIVRKRGSAARRGRAAACAKRKSRVRRLACAARARRADRSRGRQARRRALQQRRVARRSTVAAGSRPARLRR